MSVATDRQTAEGRNVSAGVVIIGRNEGDRLPGCLASVLAVSQLAVYVDSASSDDSVGRARAAGLDVVELDAGIPLTAARARNAGFEYLLKKHPELSYVQFVDGDCTLDPCWIESASRYLERCCEVAVVCGRRKEKEREASIFNALLDIEWDTPIGSVDSCGGDAMFRASAFMQARGFLPERIAGEEPELCLRLRALGYEVHRLDHDMTVHDGDMRLFSQWWLRSVRSGYAFASGAWLHGSYKFHWRETSRIVFWGLLLPCFAVLMTLHSPVLLSLLLIYPIQFLRLLYSKRHLRLRQASAWSALNILGKYAELQGAIRFCIDRFKRRSNLIEYK